MGGGFEKMVQMFPGRIVPQRSQLDGDSHDDRQIPVGDCDMKKKIKGKDSFEKFSMKLNEDGIVFFIQSSQIKTNFVEK